MWDEKQQKNVAELLRQFNGADEVCAVTGCSLEELDELSRDAFKCSFEKARSAFAAQGRAMVRQALMQKGVPGEIIFLDYAGFRTYDSVIRAKEVFGQNNFIVVSQKFHNERAIFIAGKKGIDAVGYNAYDVRHGYGVVTHAREWGARCKVFLDLISGKQPHFLGDPIDIG